MMQPEEFTKKMEYGQAWAKRLVSDSSVPFVQWDRLKFIHVQDGGDLVGTQYVFLMPLNLRYYVSVDNNKIIVTPQMNVPEVYTKRVKYALLIGRYTVEDRPKLMKRVQCFLGVDSTEQCINHAYEVYYGDSKVQGVLGRFDAQLPSWIELLKEIG